MYELSIQLVLARRRESEMVDDGKLSKYRWSLQLDLARLQTSKMAKDATCQSEHSHTKSRKFRLSLLLSLTSKVYLLRRPFLSSMKALDSVKIIGAAAEGLARLQETEDATFFNWCTNLKPNMGFSLV